jgi:flagellar hook protein FlgE
MYFNLDKHQSLLVIMGFIAAFFLVVSGILDKNDTNVSTEAGKIINLSFYDNLGYSYTAKLSVHETTTAGEYYMQLDDVLNSKGESIADYYGADLEDLVNMGSTGLVNVSESYAAAPTTYADGTSTSVGYDSVAQEYTVSYYNADGSSNSTAGTNGDGTSTITLAAAQAYLSDFDTNIADIQLLFGTSVSANSTVGAINATTGTLTVSEKAVYGGIITYDTDNGDFLTINGDTKGIKINFEDSYVDTSGATKSLKNFADINVDMTTSTLYNNNGTSTIGATSGSLKELGAGRKLGELSGLSIQNDGMIYASYDNGQSRLLGQIAVAEFANASGLAKEGDNLYSSTLNSGEFDGIGTDVTGNGGYLSTGVLEMSNVDLSTEFTEMITTQRGFQANSRIITTSDSLLEELVNLKR